MLEKELLPREDLKSALLKLIHDREKKEFPQGQLFQYIVSEDQVELEGTHYTLTYWVGFTESTFQGALIKHKIARISVSRQKQEKKQQTIEEFNLDPEVEEYAVLLLDWSSVSTGIEINIAVHEDLQKKSVGTTLFDVAEKVADDFLDQLSEQSSVYLEVQDFASPNWWSTRLARKYMFERLENSRGSMMEQPWRKRISRQNN